MVDADSTFITHVSSMDVTFVEVVDVKDGVVELVALPVNFPGGKA